MSNQIFRTIGAGILAGIALFLLPVFLLKIAVFFLLCKAAGRLLGFGGRWRERYANMSEEERLMFQQSHCHRGWHGGHPRHFRYGGPRGANPSGEQTEA